MLQRIFSLTNSFWVVKSSMLARTLARVSGSTVLLVLAYYDLVLASSFLTSLSNSFCDFAVCRTMAEIPAISMPAVFELKGS